MGWHVQIAEKAKKQLAKLDKLTQQEIKRYLQRLETVEDPLTQGKPLTGSLAGLWRYRVGKYRLICELRKNILTIEVITIDKRDTVYR